MNCPICDYKGLDANATNCPSCNADLSAFKSLNNIDSAIKKQKKTILILIILFILALAGCVAIYLLCSSGGPSAEDQQKIADQEVLIQKLEAENQQLRSELENCNSKLADCNKKLEEKLAQKDVTHTIKYGETLYYIALRYLVDGELYTKIAADNGIKNPDLIFAGDSIIIKY